MLQSTFPLVIGLTGGIASGKTTVADYLAKRGAYLVDTDIIAREVVEPHTETTFRIRQLLGDEFFHADGHLNRAKIKQHIFNHVAIKQQYEAIILPAIRQSTLDALANVPLSVCYTLLIVPLLFEKGLDKQTDYTISVDIPVEMQIQRAVSRKQSDETVIRQIIASQMPRKARNQRADFVVDNSVTRQVLYENLDNLHQTLCQLTRKGE